MRPNPGSIAALAQGCTCPVLDNNHGQWAPWPPDGWWLGENCPLHAPGQGTTSTETNTSSAGDQ